MPAIWEQEFVLRAFVSYEVDLHFCHLVREIDNLLHGLKSFDYYNSFLSLKKAKTLFEFCKFFVMVIGILQRPWVRLKGSFLLNATLVCKVTFGLIKV